MQHFLLGLSRNALPPGGGEELRDDANDAKETTSRY